MPKFWEAFESDVDDDVDVDDDGDGRDRHFKTFYYCNFHYFLNKA